MATVGHVAAAVAIAAGSRRMGDWAIVVVLTLAALAPDVDLVVGLDHRGPTHSVGFSVAVGVVAAAVARLLRRPVIATGVLAFLAAASHIPLDLLTVRDPVQALWPIADTEFVLPSAPLPSAPTTPPFLTARGLLDTLGELAWSAALVLAGVLVASFDLRLRGRGGRTERVLDQPSHRREQR